MEYQQLLVKRTEGPRISWLEEKLPLILVLRRKQFKVVFVGFAAPFFLMGFCYLVGNWFLYMGTYHYVQVMTAWERLYKVTPVNPLEDKYHDVHLSTGRNDTDVSFGSMDDSIQALLPYMYINIHVLDFVMLLFPFTFCVCALCRQKLHVFTKIMICHMFLALLKGFLAAMTTVPDSAGWAVCQARLGANGIRWLQHERSIWDLLRMEAFGIDTGQHLRFCADMMYSGHTYAVTLYALGLYEIAEMETKSMTNPHMRRLILFVVGCVAVAEQCVEVALVEINHFHYTIDMVMAIIFTLLVYTNASVTVVAMKWACHFDNFVNTLPITLTSSHIHERTNRLAHERMNTSTSQDSRQPSQDSYVFVHAEFVSWKSKVFYPPCCTPFCWVGNEVGMTEDSISRAIAWGDYFTKAEKEEIELRFYPKQNESNFSKAKEEDSSDIWCTPRELKMKDPITFHRDREKMLNRQGKSVVDV